jgi:SAM-dependent methyltransferase
MKKFLLSVHRLLLTFGINFKKLFQSVVSLPFFIRSYLKFRKKVKHSSGEFPIKSIHPQLSDRFEDSGVAKGHYFFQDLYVAQKIFLNNPVNHVDIGSSIEGFVAHVASFRKIEVLDIRKLDSKIDNVTFTQADLMSSDFQLRDYADSVSCLHVIEHFGLGRYGDPINYYGHIDGLNNIYKVIKKGGKLYFSTPIGPQRIEFNAHRVFSVQYLLSFFEPKYQLNSFAYVNEEGFLVKEPEMSEANISSNFGCNYGCGIFEFTKL